MRKTVAPVLCAVMMLGTAVVSTGCAVKASASLGSAPAKAPPPPAPAPAPAPATAPAPKPAPAPARPKVTNFEHDASGSLKLPGPVVFETGSDKLKPESDEVLAVVKDYLDAKTAITLLRVEGHTDNEGKPDTNQTLSEKRAMSVARWLTAKGIDCKRLIPVGFGQNKPIADNATAEGKSQNRRTAFVNAALNGNPIAKLPVDGGGKVAGDPCK